jgi:hypothetical protein
MTRLTKAEILTRFVAGATFGPDDMASTNDMFDSLAFCTGENEFVSRQAFRGGQDWVDLATTPHNPAPGYMVIYYQGHEIWVIDDGGNPRKLAWQSPYNSLTTALRAWVISGAFMLTDKVENEYGLESAKVLWPDKQTGQMTVHDGYREYSYPGYIIRIEDNGDTLPVVTNA